MTRLWSPPRWPPPFFGSTACFLRLAIFALFCARPVALSCAPTLEGRSIFLYTTHTFPAVFALFSQYVPIRSPPRLPQIDVSEALPIFETRAFLPGPLFDRPFKRGLPGPSAIAFLLLFPLSPPKFFRSTTPRSFSPGVCSEGRFVKPFSAHSGPA